METQKLNSQLVPGMVNLFKALHKVVLSCNANTLYVRILCVFNDFQWSDKVEISDAQMRAFTGLSQRSLNSARDELAEIGLISFQKNLIGRFSTVTYTILIDDECDAPTTSSTNASTSASMNASMSASMNASTMHQSIIEPKNTSLNREDKDIDKDKEENKEKVKEIVALSSLLDRMMSRKAWADTFCANNGMSEDDLREEIATFVRFLQNSGCDRKEMGDAIRHFAAWHGKRSEAARQKQDTERQARERAAEARRREQEEEAERKRRFQQECEERGREFMIQLKQLADAGDKKAKEILNKKYPCTHV